MRILHTLVIALTALGAVSCANDEKELFSLPAAERIDQVVKKDRAALEASPNGWKFDYFLGRSYSGPGVAMMVTFRNGKATMASDASDTAVFYTADYDVVKDQGPVLTFNTFLAPIHSLAGGMASFPEGRQGDYEFSILSTSADTIRLRGKKWGNEMMLTRNPIGLKQDSVIMGAIKMRENMITDSIYLCHGKDTIPGAAFDLDNRHFDIHGAVQLSSPMVFSPKGFTLAQPLHYKDQVYSDFTWNDSARTFSSADMTISFRIARAFHFCHRGQFHRPHRHALRPRHRCHTRPAPTRIWPHPHGRRQQFHHPHLSCEPSPHRHAHHLRHFARRRLFVGVVHRSHIESSVSARLKLSCSPCFFRTNPRPPRETAGFFLPRLQNVPTFVCLIEFNTPLNARHSQHRHHRPRRPR